MLETTRTTQAIESEALWMNVDACPACGSSKIANEHALPDSAYFFGEEKIDFPAHGISVVVCGECSLRYKTTVPHPTYLSQVFTRQAGKKWMEPYDFSGDIAELRKFVGEEISDLLDIGASSGALLHACEKAGVKGRRSALDVVSHPGLERYMAGEFIQGLLDCAPLRWSGEPYQAVTLFDVAEHLYNPRIAFQNLCELVKDGGVVCIETGNIESQWPTKYGPAEWWYVRLFEHHIFWSPASLEKIVREYGFRIMYCKKTRHKSRAVTPALRATGDVLKVGLYCASPGAYSGLADLLGKWTKQPWSPFTRDHLRVYLKKVVL